MLNEKMTADQPVGEDALDGEEHAELSVCINCNADGSYSVYSKPLEPADENTYPDGFFGLKTIDDALKAVLALKQGDRNYVPAGMNSMMQSYQDDTTTRKEPGGY